MVIESDHCSPLPLDMRIIIKICALAIAGSLLTSTSASAVVKQGSTCKKVGITSTVNGMKFTCIKSGKKLLWSKGVAVKKAAPTPTAQPVVLPTSFEDLYVNRKGISLAAWQKSSEIIKSTKSKAGTLEVFTGPNTTPNFDDYPTPVNLVSRLFPSRGEPTRTIVIRFKYVDIEWADLTLKSKISAEDLSRLNNNEGGRAITGRCESATKNCNGAMQQTTASGVSLIIQGVPNEENKNDPTGKARFYSGMLEAHEYFHALQRIPIMGKTDVWPHAWFREGSAEWVQNMAVNYDNFNSYKLFLSSDCGYSCLRMTEPNILEFLQKSNENFTPPGYDQYLNYSLASRLIEALVAIKGPDTLIDLYEQMGTRLSFDQAFKNTYGVEWSYALPILAKTIHANLNNK